jgi:hypothetical protein
MRSQWHWLAYSLIFWLVLGAGNWMIYYGIDKKDYALANMGYLTVGSMIGMMIWTIIETVLYKLGRLESRRTWNTTT